MAGRVEKPSEVYRRLCLTLPKPLALYIVCAAQDVAYDPCEVEDWEDYEAEGGFTDGETDYNAAALAGMDRAERWETVWGEGYSENDYKRLDELYGVMTAQLSDVGVIDRQQEDTARTCARMALQRDKLIRSQNKDDVAAAKNFDEMIRKNLADANMRKADILPAAQQRPDGIVDALRKKYGLSMEMTKDDFLAAFYQWCRQRKHPQTVDAEEHALLGIVKTMQKNDDMTEPTDLPDELRLSGFESEFADEPNDQEAEVYDYLHLVRGQFNAPDDDIGGSL